MTPTEFGYWLRGITDRTVDQFSVDSLASLVLQKAAEILDRVPAKAEPVGLTSLTVAQFCVHNVNVKEACPSCANFANPTWRVFGMRLPIDTRQVYIRAHDRTPRNEDAETGTHAAEPARDEGGKTGAAEPRGG